MHRAKRLLVVALAAALATVPVALAGPDPATGGSTEQMRAAQASPGGAAGTSATAHATRSVALVARAARAEAAKPPPSAIVRVRARDGLALRSRPWGGVAVRVGATTEFGSARRLGVVRRRGPWLGVTTAALPNGRLGWIHRRNAGVALERTRWAIRADVSSRTAVLQRDGRTVRRLSVAVGRPGSPTPTGRFAVTDKLSGGRFGPYYGCCILALSATQPHTPPGWTGGNRMAIHGTSDPSSIGAAASAGCLRAADADLRFLIHRVPVGTPVTIRR